MKVILKQNLENLGAIGAIVDVKRGYARNYLLPRDLAAAVAPGVMEEIEARRRQEAEQEKAVESELRSLADQLGSTSVTITAKVNEEGRLFGSVGVKEIIAALAADGFTRVTSEMVAQAEPFKEPGVFEVPIKLNPEIEAICKVWVVPEE